MPRTTFTKKKIFLAAIDCFSQKGYKQSTMQEIADRVKIKAASIYNHFTGKEEILGEIFEYYKINFNKYRNPVDAIVEAAENKPFDKVLPMMFYTFGTEKEHEVMMKITHIIVDLKFENEEAKKLFRTAHIDEPTEYLHNVFSALIDSGKLKSFDYEELTFQIVSFSHMLMVISLLEGSTRKEGDKKYRKGIVFFQNFLKPFELTKA